MNQVLRKGARKEARSTMINEQASDTAAAVTAEGATGAPQKSASKKVASQRKGSPKKRKPGTAAKATKQAKTETKSLRKAASPRAQGKGKMILEMIGRPKGATLSEIMTATGWQAHSVRGFISTSGKKHNLKIESEKN